MSKHVCLSLAAVTLGLTISAPAIADEDTTKRYIVHFDESAVAQPATRMARATAAGDSTARHVRSLAAGGELYELSVSEAEVMASAKGVVAVEEDRMVTLAGDIIDPLWRRHWYMHDPKVGIEVRQAWTDARGEGAVVALFRGKSTRIKGHVAD